MVRSRSIRLKCHKSRCSITRLAHVNLDACPRRPRQQNAAPYTSFYAPIVAEYLVGDSRQANETRVHTHTHTNEHMLQMLQPGILLQMHITSVSQTAGGGGGGPPGGPPGVSNRNLAVHQESQTASFFCFAGSFLYCWTPLLGVQARFVSLLCLLEKTQRETKDRQHHGKPKGQKEKPKRAQREKHPNNKTKAKTTHNRSKTKQNTRKNRDKHDTKTNTEKTSNTIRSR